MERVWIYQASRFMTPEERDHVLREMEAFTGAWKAHGKALAASAEVRHDLFLILRIDDSVAPPTGCSIDKSVHTIQAIQSELGLDFFNRMNVAYRERESGTIRLASRTEFEQAIASGAVQADTLVFNNLIQTYAELDTAWEIPFRDSWHSKVFALPQGMS